MEVKPFTLGTFKTRLPSLWQVDQKDIEFIPCVLDFTQPLNKRIREN